MPANSYLLCHVKIHVLIRQPISPPRPAAHEFCPGPPALTEIRSHRQAEDSQQTCSHLGAFAGELRSQLQTKCSGSAGFTAPTAVWWQAGSPCHVPCVLKVEVASSPSSSSSKTFCVCSCSLVVGFTLWILWNWKLLLASKRSRLSLEAHIQCGQLPKRRSPKKLDRKFAIPPE